jgi:membrane dipeptidase
MGVAGFPMINRGSYAFAAAPTDSFSARAVKLVTESVVIDMLAPLKLTLSPTIFDQPLSPGDLSDFRASGVTAMHHAYAIGGFGAKEEALAYIASWSSYIANHSELFTLIRRANDIDVAKRGGKVGVIMGIQNADHFQNPDDVVEFFRLGLRCAQLTYNSQNFVGGGSTERVDAGVSDYGVSIMQAMNKVGMLIDVSHSGDRTTLDAIELSERPIAITHSNCRAIAPHPRNKSDEAIRKLAAKGGVMGITGVRMFVRDSDPTSVIHIVDHIEHVVKLAGIEHVGIGSDADLNGYDDMPADQYARLKAAYKSGYAFRDKIDIDGFDHPRKYFALADELIRRGYSDANISLILGKNFRRLLSATWG